MPALGTCAGHDPAGRPTCSTAGPTSAASAHRPGRAPQRVRPPDRLVRGRPRRGRLRPTRSTPCSSGRPVVERVGPDVEVLARIDGRPVCCRQGPVAGHVVPPRAVGRHRLARAVPDHVRRRRVPSSKLTRSGDATKERSAMSGHSKWATIKHKKGAADQARGKLFAKIIRQVEVAARQGGGDIDMNPTLRTMYQKARSASVPARHHREGHQAGHRRPRGRHLRADHLRGLRPPRRGHPHRRADRQPQPHRLRRAHRAQEERRHRSPSPARWPGSSSARAS